MSVHILKLPTQPQRVVIDPETRLLYNKAYNQGFFLIRVKWKQHSVGLSFPCINCPGTQGKGMVTETERNKNTKQTQVQNTKCRKRIRAIPGLLLASWALVFLIPALSVCLTVCVSEQQHGALLGQHQLEPWLSP